MNEIFSITRFGKLLKNDLVRCLPKGYGTLIAFLCIMPTIWAMNAFIFNNTISMTSRLIGLIFCTMLCTFLTVYKLYGHANHKKAGVDFVMLPASIMEKFLSMILISCLLIPVLFFISAYLVDCFLATLPLNIYQDYIALNTIFTFESLKNMGIFILFLSFALCGNMLFKKAKMAKTILSILGLFMVIGYITSISAYKVIKNMAYTNEDGTMKSMIGGNPLSEDQVNESTIIINGEKTTGEETVTVTREGKTYTMSHTNINSNMMQLLSTHEKTILFLYDLFLFVIIPGVMYFLTYHRIKQQQL